MGLRVSQFPHIRLRRPTRKMLATHVPLRVFDLVHASAIIEGVTIGEWIARAVHERLITVVPPEERQIIPEFPYQTGSV